MDLNEETKIRCFHCHMAFPTSHQGQSQFEENASINSRSQTNADAGKLNILE